MRIILLAGYRPTSADNCPWLENEEGLPRLEKRMREARELGQNCIVVLAGESAEAALRLCPSLEKCELVFDNQTQRPNLLSNLRAALQNIDLPAVVLPAELKFGDLEAVKQLAAAAVQQGLNTPHHMFQISENAFPLVLSPEGCKELVHNKQIEGLADPRLTRHVPCLSR